MREIKFRAWDGQRMIHFDNMSIGIGKGYKGSKRDKEPYVYFTNDTFNGKVRLGNHEIMQYTGLKDKNGKEIYELHEINNKYRVVYKFNKYILQLISNSDIFVEINNYDEYEITGEYCPLA